MFGSLTKGGDVCPRAKDPGCRIYQSWGISTIYPQAPHPQSSKKQRQPKCQDRVAQKSHPIQYCNINASQWQEVSSRVQVPFQVFLLFSRTPTFTHLPASGRSVRKDVGVVRDCSRLGGRVLRITNYGLLKSQQGEQGADLLEGDPRGRVAFGRMHNIRSRFRVANPLVLGVA